MRVGILTVSDRAARGDYLDESGPTLRVLIEAEIASSIAEYGIVPDSEELISQTLTRWADDCKLDLVLTTGGTGFAPRDVTPEATRAVIEREAYGLILLMLQTGLQATPFAALSRAVAGIRGGTLIVNLPGNPNAAKDNLKAILAVLPHAIDLIREAPEATENHRKAHGHHRAGKN
jgi:molybdopterin adenylyltransferase